MNNEKETNLHIDFSNYNTDLTDVLINAVKRINKLDASKHQGITYIAALIATSVNRAIAINKGFEILTKSDNFICAPALLRMQIENSGRIYSVTKKENPFIFVKNWIVNSTGDKPRFNDSECIKQLSEVNSTFSDMYDNYKKACKLVHLGSFSFWSTIIEKDIKKDITIHATGESNMPLPYKMSVVKCMEYANTVLLQTIKYITNFFCKP